MHTHQKNLSFPICVRCDYLHHNMPHYSKLLQYRDREGRAMFEHYCQLIF